MRNKANFRRGQTRQTNPISCLRAGRRAARLRRAGRSQRDGRCLRQTNPIRARGARKTIAKAGGLDAATPEGTNVPNEPNLPPAALGPAGPIVRNKANFRRDQTRQTNPISCLHAGRRRARQRCPSRCHWTKACKTKPIPSRPKRGTTPLLERSYAELAIQRASAKQSQFAAGPRGPRPAGRGPWDAVQTKPICPRRIGMAITRAFGLDDATGQETNVQNEPNFGGSFEFGVPSVKMGKVAVRASDFTLPTGPQTVRAKQSQFPAGPDGAGLGEQGPQRVVQTKPICRRGQQDE